MCHVSKKTARSIGFSGGNISNDYGVISKNKEETIYELMELTGASVRPYTRHHLRPATECMW